MEPGIWQKYDEQLARNKLLFRNRKKTMDKLECHLLEEKDLEVQEKHAPKGLDTIKTDEFTPEKAASITSVPDRVYPDQKELGEKKAQITEEESTLPE